MIEVVDPGWATTIQDRGRPGFAALGVPRSGALDVRSLARANRLVGNVEDAAGLESAGGLTIRAHRGVLVATSTEGMPVSLRAGEHYRVVPSPHVTWTYLAVRGGIAVEAVLGSRSHDTLSGIGPAPVGAGAMLPIGDDPATAVPAELAPTRVDEQPVAIWPGPRADWFEPGALDLLRGSEWTVSPDTSRVGMRLRGPLLRRRRHDELASEGLVAGAIQVPPDGQPVVMLADHPTTGGYPVIAVVGSSEIGRLAQRRPGSRIRFLG